MEVVLGGALALASAALWAVTNLLLRAQVQKVGGGTANAWRTFTSTVAFLPVFLLLRRPADILAIPPRTLAILLLAVLLSMVIGDILQFTAIRRLGIALAMPIASAYPILTLGVAALFLGEALTPRAAAGATLVVAGVILVALPRRALDDAERAQRRARSTNHWLGVGLAVASAVCAAGATTLTRQAIRDIDILAANMLRLPFSALACGLIGAVQRGQPPWRIERRMLPPLALAGIVSLGSGLCYLNALKLVGASTTATLNASAPIFGLLGAVALLGERPSRRNVLGTLVAFAGIALVVR